MPVEDCTVDGQPAKRWGPEGHPYPYTKGSKSSEQRAYALAARQGAAIHASQAASGKG